jgi:hypothetical protein
MTLGAFSREGGAVPENLQEFERGYGVAVQLVVTGAEIKLRQVQQERGSTPKR